MNSKLIITIFLLTLTAKIVENQSCLNWDLWEGFKYNYGIQFYNSSLELTA